MNETLLHALASIPLIIVCHLFGDFLLQNHWMQTKSKSSFVCSVHVFCYSLPLLLPFFLGIISPLQIAAILSEHWLQDRFGLHLKWMSIYKQTTPDKWPVGPLCMDQSLHIACIALVMLFL